MSATIITLGGQPSYSFNDIDDYSGGDGSRRDRRKQKRSTRKERREELRNVRKEGRGARREMRKENRGERKELRQQTRQTKRDIRKGVKPQEEVSEAQVQEDQMMEQVPQEQPEIQDTSAQEQDSQDQGSQDAGSQDTGSQDQGAYSDEGGSSDEGGYSDEGSYSDEGGSSDEGGYSDEGDDQGFQEDGNYDFDGDYSDLDGIQLEDFSEMSDSQKPSVKVNPAISDICNKIEWNKELCRKLEQSRDRYGNINNLTAKIQERKRRIGQLENTLKNYEQNGLDYSSAEGDLVPSMRRSDGRANPVKSKEIREARIRARRRRRNINATPVSKNLDAKISNQRIVIPPSFSNAAGTGLIALDDSGDYDADELDIKMSNANGETIELGSNANGETIELTSNADGQKSINWTAVAIGVGIGALGIYLMKRYKLV